MTEGTKRWLILRLDAPLMAFGGVTIDQVGVTRNFPAASMLTGMIANALGWRRTDAALHQSLQDRLVFAARLERPAVILTDTQNAGLEKTDRGWTTSGEPEGRDGASYGAPHRRRRDYLADASIAVALRLEPPDASPDLTAVAAALDRPARPLFVGRKSCLPADRILCGELEAPTAYAALQRLPSEASLPAVWPLGEGPADGTYVDRIFDICDNRNWQTGLHGGTRKIIEGKVAKTDAGQ